MEKGERVEDRVYAKLSEVEKKQRPFTRLADNRVIYSDLIIKGQPPPPPYQPMELKEVFNPKPCVTVIPTFDEGKFELIIQILVDKFLKCKLQTYRKQNYCVRN